MAKIKRYTETILVRISKIAKARLLSESDRVMLEPAAYCRKAIEYCIEKKCIENGRER